MISRLLGDLGLRSHGLIVRVVREWSENEADLADVYLADAPSQAELPLVARLAHGGSQPVVVYGGAGGIEAVAYLDAGAADYAPRGIASAELAARIRATARHTRSTHGGADSIALGDVSISTTRREVTKAGKPVRLTPHEFVLLETLIAARGDIVSHDRLVTAVWGVTSRNNHHALRVYVRQLRRKLETDVAFPAIILNKRGVGYYLNMGSQP